MDLSTNGERPVVFDSQGRELLGIIAAPARDARPLGIVIVVGGPQYRVGSHRQFTLLARYLAGQGIASLRFDYHGNGDSDGPPALGIGGLDADIRAAIDTLLAALPMLDGVVLWGLCGAASAAALYAPSDSRVSGLVLLNPWVRTAQGLARTRLRHHYLARLTDRDFWRRLTRGEVALAPSMRSFVGSVKQALGSGANTSHELRHAGGGAEEDFDLALPDAMLRALRRARRPALVLLSGDQDVTANEFRDLCAASAGWREWVASPGVRSVEIAGSNHTFARADWREQVERLTSQWVESLK